MRDALRVPLHPALAAALGLVGHLGREGEEPCEGRIRGRVED